MAEKLSDETQEIQINENLMEYQFFKDCGENINVCNGKLKASWTHRFSDGVAFSCQPIHKYNRLKLDLTGTGHAYVGTMSRDPATIKNMRMTLSRDVKVLKDMKVHKRLAAVEIDHHVTDEEEFIVFNFNGEKKVIHTTNECWLFLYIKFGDLLAVLHSEDANNRRFHDITGSNIRCMDPDRRSIKLQVENPSAVCCLNKRLKPEHSLTFKTCPLVENGHVPSRCHLKLGIIDLDPSELRSCDPESFVVDSKVPTPKRWIIVHKFNKDQIDGELKLFLTKNGDLYYNHDSGVEGTHKCKLKDINSGVLIVLDLFRSQVDITESHDENASSEDKDYDYVIPDAEMIENIKRRLRISDKRLGTLRQKSSDGYVEMLDLKKDETREAGSSNNGTRCSPKLRRFQQDSLQTNIEACK